MTSLLNTSEKRVRVRRKISIYLDIYDRVRKRCKLARFEVLSYFEMVCEKIENEILCNALPKSIIKKNSVSN